MSLRRYISLCTFDTGFDGGLTTREGEETGMDEDELVSITGAAVTELEGCSDADVSERFVIA